MERPAALSRARRALTTIALAAAVFGASATPAGAGWTRPVRISAPGSIEILGPQISSSPAGAVAVSFNTLNLDSQATGTAFLALASPGRGFGVARRVGPGMQEVLALAFSGRTLVLLTAHAGGRQPCCATVQVTRRGPGGKFSRPQTIVSDVGGAAIGRLVVLANGGLLAVIAGPQGLWVAQAGGTGRFARARGLTRRGVPPVALAVTGTSAGGSDVVWTEGSGQRVISASGRPGAGPSRPRTVLTVPGGHQIDGLQLVPSAVGLTLGWTESWNDALGVYHSRAMAADLRGPGKLARPRSLSSPAAVASGLALAGDGSGGQVAAWNVCVFDICAVHVTSRAAHARWFAAASRLGRIDAGESAQVTTARNRGSLAGWITGGRVVLATLRRGASHATVPRAISGSPAANLDLAFGPTGIAIATWTQGTAIANVFASLLR